jgi:hypothetical protein
MGVGWRKDIDQTLRSSFAPSCWTSARLGREEKVQLKLF